MGEAMVTGRMAPGKKRRGGLVLQREGLTASDGASGADDEASSALVDRAFEHGDLPADGPDLAAIARAARFSSRVVI